MKTLLKKLLTNKSFDSGKYWEERYASGGNSGDGSYGRLSLFKAEFINDFLQRNNVQTAIEFGCGDGHQLSLIKYPKYLGFDVSATTVQNCAKKFGNDDTKSFILYTPNAFHNNFVQCDLSLSLDVLYHIVERSAFEKYLIDLFGVSSKFVIIYSTNFDKSDTEHVLHRKFTDFVQSNLVDFELMEVVKNPYPGTGDQESNADFYIYKRKN